MKTSLPHKIRLLSGLVLLAVATSVWSQTEVSQEDHSYKPLTLKLNETGSKYVRFIIWHQQWAVTNNLAIDDAKFQVSTMARRSRFLAYAQVSSRFLLLMHFGLNNLSPTNLDGLGNGGNGPQFFLHDAWTEFKVVPKSLYIGTGLHYWKGLTRLASQEYTQLHDHGQSPPFAPWHSLG